MKVFLSWSGQVSQQIAQAFCEWLPTVIQAVHPYFTPDMSKGIRWSPDIAEHLHSCSVGLLFLTRDNLEAPWIMFEAGALSKQLGNSKVCPVVFGVGKTDLRGPLSQFQATDFSEEDISKLLHTINNELGESRLSDRLLSSAFKRSWPEFRDSVQSILNSDELPEPTSQVRTDRELIEEVLTIVRAVANREVERFVGGNGIEQDITIDSVYRIWPRILQDAARISRKTEMMLLTSKPVSVENNTLLLHFPNKSAHEIMSKPDKALFVQKLIARSLGVDASRISLRMIHSLDGDTHEADINDPFAD